MSSDVWKIGQNMNAQSMYNDIKENGLYGNFFLKSESIAISQLTNMCIQMLGDFDEIINDQNEYMIELEGEVSEFEILKDDIYEKIKTKFKEIKALEKKEQKGTITEEEQKELEDKKGELQVLMGDSDKQVSEMSANAAKKGEGRFTEQKSKIAVAKNYGEVTVEKGTPLAESEASSSSFRQLFGVKGLGEMAVEAGTNLLEKVDFSTEISTNIESNYKKMKA